jgi:hypothetical protein
MTAFTSLMVDQDRIWICFFFPCRTSLKNIFRSGLYDEEAWSSGLSDLVMIVYYVIVVVVGLKDCKNKKVGWKIYNKFGNE